MKITVLAKPGCRVPRVEKIDEHTVRICVRARAVDGAANNAILAALSEYLGVAKSHVNILRGVRGKTKIFEII